ncbi:MAG: phage holin family protein, partial [Acidobacteriota bacterium]|nr:phage holin family protein [Acidobacteriota bacterium]
VRPLLTMLTCPLLILTLGLFTFVINALILWLTSAAAARFGLGFHVAGFWSAFWGALVVSLVSVLLSVFVSEPDPRRG